MGLQHDQARALIDVGRYEAALDVLTRLAATDPTDATTHVLRAACLVDLERPGEALEAASAALASDPTRADAHFLRSRALENLGAPPHDVLDAAHRAVELAPDWAASWLQLVRSLIAGGQFDEAESLLRQMRQRFPAAVETEIATAVVELARPSIVEKTLGAVPTPLLMLITFVAILAGGIFVYLGIVLVIRLRKAHASGRAEAAVRRALAVEPESFHLGYLLAQLYEDQGRWGSALRLRLSLGGSEPRPELVAAVERSVRRDLLILGAGVSAAAAVALGSVIGVVADGGVPPWVGAPLLVLSVLIAVLVARAGSHRLLGRVPTAVSERVVGPWRRWLAAGEIVVASTCLLWAALASDDRDPVVITARWAAAGIAVILTGDSIASATRRRRAAADT